MATSEGLVTYGHIPVIRGVATSEGLVTYGHIPVSGGVATSRANRGLSIVYNYLASEKWHRANMLMMGGYRYHLCRL